jgi:hypothetical protein
MMSRLEKKMAANAGVYPELPHFALDDTAALADFLLCRT